LQELADRLGAHRQTVYGWLRRGKLKGRLLQEPTRESHHDNTIEQAFSKLKAHLRKAGARTLDAL
jgi:transposase